PTRRSSDLIFSLKGAELRNGMIRGATIQIWVITKIARRAYLRQYDTYISNIFLIDKLEKAFIPILARKRLIRLYIICSTVVMHIVYRPQFCYFIPIYAIIGQSNIFFICRFNNHAHWSILPVSICIIKTVALLFTFQIDNHVMGKRKCTASPYGMPV